MSILSGWIATTSLSIYMMHSIYQVLRGLNINLTKKTELKTLIILAVISIAPTLLYYFFK